MPIISRTLCGLACLLTACSGSDAPERSESFRPTAVEPSEPSPIPSPSAPELHVRVAAPEGAEGRLVIAAFAGENAWGWTLDVLELEAPRFPEEAAFTTLQPGVVTLRAVLDRAPLDWINPGPEDLLVTTTLTLGSESNNVDLVFGEALDGQARPSPPSDLGLPLRVGCNCEGLSHVELAILSSTGEVLQTQTLTDPELPADLTMRALDPGSYRVAWRTDDYPDWGGDRPFAMPLVNAPLMVLVAPRPAPVDGRTPGDNDNGNQPADPEEPSDDPEPEPEEPQEDPVDPQADPEDPNEGNQGDENPPQDRQNLRELRENGDFPNRAEQAQPVEFESRIYGRIGELRDFDWFVFELGQNSSVVIETSGDTDTLCQVVRDGDGASSQDDDSGQASNCRLIFEDLSAGTYRVRISHYSWLGQGDYTLDLRSRLPEP